MPHYSQRRIAKRGVGATPSGGFLPFTLTRDAVAERATINFSQTGTRLVDDHSSARIAEAYSLDAAWAGAATLNDPRFSGRCGGGGCNAPSCAYQSWDIGLPCNEQNLQAYMFQLPRFLWATGRLAQLYATPPEPFETVTNYSIASKAFAWATWLNEVYRAIGLVRWSANVRWELVASKIKLPFEWGLQPYLQPDASPSPFWGVSATSEVATDVLLARFVADLVQVGRGVEAGSGLTYRSAGLPAAPTLLMESPLTWAYQQAGLGYHPDCRPWLNSGNIDHGGEPRPLAWSLRVPQSADDFSAQYGLWFNYATPTMPAMPVTSAQGRRIAYEYQCGWGSPRWDVYRGWMDNRPVGPSGQLSAPWSAEVFGRFLAAGRRTVNPLRADQLAMLWPAGASATPLMQVLVAKERCAAYMGLEFGNVVSSGLSAWADMILALPEDLRAGVDPRALEGLSQRMGQQQLNEAAGYVSMAFGTAAGLVTAVVPQPYGAIIGAVIALVGAIASAIVAASYDLGLARPDRPPCPPPPLLRNIAEATCDFDTSRRGVEEVLGKSVITADLAGRGVLDPRAWIDALEALADEPIRSESPRQLAPPDRRPEPTFPWVPILGGSAVGLALALVLRSR